MRDQILSVISKLISDQAGQPVSITEETNVKALFSDVFPWNDVKKSAPLDSLDFIEVVMAAEDHYEIELPDDEIEKVKTGADFVNLIIASHQSPRKRKSL